MNIETASNDPADRISIIFTSSKEVPEEIKRKIPRNYGIREVTFTAYFRTKKMSLCDYLFNKEKCLQNTFILKNCEPQGSLVLDGYAYLYLTKSDAIVLLNKYFKKKEVSFIEKNTSRGRKFIVKVRLDLITYITFEDRYHIQILSSN